MFFKFISMIIGCSIVPNNSKILYYIKLDHEVIKLRLNPTDKSKLSIDNNLLI